MVISMTKNKPGLEFIKLEFILKLKIKRIDWLLVRKQPIITFYFEFETVFKFYNLSLTRRKSFTVPDDRDPPLMLSIR